MPTWCRYCHDEGHTKFECKKALAHIICYNCDLSGHRQADCNRPKRGSNAREHKKPRKTPPTPSKEASKSDWAPDNSKDQEVTESAQQTAQAQQQPQQQQTQREQIAFEESTSGSSYPPPPPGDQAETNLAQVNADFQDLQTTSKDPDLDDDEDDESDDEYMPSASEGESGVEDMSDLESDKDEVADLHQQQQQDVNIFTNGAVYGDSNTHTTPSSAYSSNYNESTANHQNRL